MTQDTSHTRLPGLDGVRALAVIGVVWHHAGPVGAALPSLPFALNLNGFLGVDLFFVLSGLLITGLLLREHARSGRISLAKFYVRRSLRIFPLYYAVLALLTLYFIGAAASGSTQRSLFLHDLPWLVTYTSNWVPIRELTAGPALAAWLLLLAALACWPGDIQGWPRLAFHVVATLSLAGIVLRPSSRVVSALEWKPLAFVGMVRYGIYLLHLLVLDAVQRALSRWHVDMPGTLFVVGLAGTVALAALSYRFFERPLLRLKDRWRSA